MLEAMRDNAGSTLPEAELMRRVADVPVGFDSGQVMRFGDAIGGDQDILRTIWPGSYKNSWRMGHPLVRYSSQRRLSSPTVRECRAWTLPS